MQLQHTFIKLRPETMFFTHVPFFVDNLKREIRIWRPRFESDDNRIDLAIDILKVELGSLHLVFQFRVENVEFVALDNLWRRVVCVVVSLVVLVPFEALLNSVVILRLLQPRFRRRIEWRISKLLFVLTESLLLQMVVQLLSHLTFVDVSQSAVFCLETNVFVDIRHFRIVFWLFHFFIEMRWLRLW